MVSLSNHGRLAILFGAARSRRRATPFIYDVDAQGKITGIEILHVSRTRPLEEGTAARHRQPTTGASLEEISD